jgi:hypothetical protein
MTDVYAQILEQSTTALHRDRQTAGYRSSNTFNPGNAEVGSVPADVEFSCYDALPKRVRKALAEAPVKIMAENAYQLWKSDGEEAALDAISDLIHQVCPDYR